MPASDPAADSVQTISLLGIPFDANSSYLRGPAQAPKAIREALHSDSSNLWTEDGIDLDRKNSFHDAGDVVLSENGARRSLRLKRPLKRPWILAIL